MALLLIVAVLGASCGGSDATSSAPKKSTAEIAAGISSQLVASKFLTESAAECVGKRVAPHLSTQGQRLSANVDAVTGLSASDQKALLDALDGCVPADQFANIVAQATAGALSGDNGSGTIGSTLAGPTPLTTCISAKLMKAYPTTGEMFEALLAKKGESAILSMLTACGLTGAAPPTSG